MIETLFNWDWRPAVELTDGRIFAALDDANPTAWTELSGESADDVEATAGVLTRREFARIFPAADLSTVPGKPAVAE